MNDRLFVAIIKPDNRAIADMLNSGQDVNETNDLGYTLLHMACADGDMELVDIILDHSRNRQPIDLALRTKKGLTAWQLAYLHSHFDVASKISDAEMEVEHAGCRLWPPKP